MSRTQHQTFESRVIPRSLIQPAPYNPRTISAYSKNLLTAKIKEVGLVEPLVWNEETGNLVSGHQRLSILDAEEGNQSYELEVAVVRLQPKVEKEMVVFLNNANAQGVWDEEAFGALLSAGEVSLESMGFNEADLQLQFPDLVTTGLVAEQEGGDVAETVTDIESIKADRARSLERALDSPDADAGYYLVVCFRTAKDKEQFLRVNGMDLSATHITADEMEPMLRPEHLWRVKEPEPPGGG